MVRHTRCYSTLSFSTVEEVHLEALRSAQLPRAVEVHSVIAAATAAASSAALVVAPVPFQPQEGRGVGHVSRVEGCVGWVHRVERQGRDVGRGGDVAAAWRQRFRGGCVVCAGAGAVESYG